MAAARAAAGPPALLLLPLKPPHSSVAHESQHTAVCLLAAALLNLPRRVLNGRVGSEEV